GGVSQVFKAWHTAKNCIVALKVIRQELLSNPEAFARFQREMHAFACLSHPNIVSSIDSDLVGQTNFFAMEYVEGTDLGKLVQLTGPLKIPIACHYVRQAALGLQHAHEHGLVHRDIKPANLLLDRGGLVKVHDLGLARVMHDSKITERVGGHHPLIGTADYLAPEQAHDSHNVDIRADIYGLGGAFYFLLTGHCPFPEGTVAQKLLLHQQKEPDSVHRHRSDVPAAVAAIVE